VRRRGINREGLAALLPVQDGREDAVRDALAGLPGGPLSPFARIGSTHFARLVMVEEFPGPDGEPLADMPACLFFGAEFDIPMAGYVEAICALLPTDADAVFGACAGYPGADVPPLFAEWMLRHRIRPGFSLQGNPDATVRDVVAALGLRERIIEFALATRALAPAALRAAWEAEDWGRAA
jgi:hypothetical protein